MLCHLKGGDVNNGSRRPPGMKSNFNQAWNYSGGLARA
jgi:hypothetical protein